MHYVFNCPLCGSEDTTILEVSTGTLESPVTSVSVTGAGPDDLYLDYCDTMIQADPDTTHYRCAACGKTVAVSLAELKRLIGEGYIVILDE